MRKFYKLTALMCCAALSLGGLAACGESGNKDNDGKITLKIWAPQEEQDVIDVLSENFLDMHKNEDGTYEQGYNVEFDFKVMGFESAVESLGQDPSAAGDIFAFPSGAIPELYRAGNILPISDALGGAKLREEIGEKAILGCEFGEVQSTNNNRAYLYGAPFTPNNWIMYYDTSVYTPEDIQSLEKMMAKETGMVYNFAMPMTDSWYNTSFFLTAGCRAFGPDGDEDDRCDFNSADGLLAANYMYDLSYNPKFHNDIGGSALANLGTQVAAFCSGDWDADSAKEKLGARYGAVKLPTINLGGQDRQMITLGDYKAYGVNSQTKNAKVAIEFAAYLATTEAQLIRFQLTHTSPTAKTLVDRQDIKNRPEVIALMASDANSVKQPTSAQLKSYWGCMDTFGAGISTEKTITKENMQTSLDKLVANITAKLGN